MFYFPIKQELIFFLKSSNVENSKQKILNILRNVLQHTLVSGEQPVVISTPKMVVQYEKNDADQLANKTLDIGPANVDLPSWCDMQPAPCDQSKSVMIQVGKLQIICN